MSRKPNPTDSDQSQIRQIRQGLGARQRRPPRHSQQYQLLAPARPTDGSSEEPALGHGIGKPPVK